jgi:MinD superfamily P-loop ATPase
MSDVLDLHQLLKVQHVSVVQAVDLDSLAGLLKQLLQGQKEADDQIQRQQAEIDALKAQADQQHGADAGASGTAPADAAASTSSLQVSPHMCTTCTACQSSCSDIGYMLVVICWQQS